MGSTPAQGSACLLLSRETRSFGDNSERSTRAKLSRALNPRYRKHRSATSPDVVFTSACRPHNRIFRFAINQNCHYCSV